MAATVPLTQSPYLKEWMTKAYPQEEASTVKKKWTTGRYSSWEMNFDRWSEWMYFQCENWNGCSK